MILHIYNFIMKKKPKMWGPKQKFTIVSNFFVFVESPKEIKPTTNCSERDYIGYVKV